MKIKSIVLLAITICTAASVQANPFKLVHDVVVAVDNNIGPRALLGYQPQRPIVSTYYENRNTPIYYDNNRCQRQESRAQYQQRDSFNHKVIKVGADGTVRRSVPPPEAYVWVPYPGPAPKHLYDDKSIRVHDRGDMHYVIYRKPGW